MFNHSASIEELATQVEKCQDMAHLSKLALNSALNLFHHFSQVRDTVHSTAKTSAFILGVNCMFASTASPDTDLLSVKAPPDAMKVVKREDIMECTMIKEIDNLSNSNTQSICPRNSIPVPPFLVRPLNTSTHHEEPKKVSLDRVTAIKDFDTKHQDNNECVEKSAIACRPLLHWLCTAATKVKNEEISCIQIQPCTNFWDF